LAKDNEAHGQRVSQGPVQVEQHRPECHSTIDSDGPHQIRDGDDLPEAVRDRCEGDATDFVSVDPLATMVNEVEGLHGVGDEKDLETARGCLPRGRVAAFRT